MTEKLSKPYVMNLTNNKNLLDIEKKIGYVFQDKSLLSVAFTHPSFSNENNHCPDYQRLEFIGDAILGLVVGLKLFRMFPSDKEGELTKKRASLVSAETLAEVIDSYGFINYLRVGTGHAGQEVVSSENVKCDLFEALLGAIYLDSACNFSFIESFIWGSLEKYIDKPHLDFKSKTLEYCAKNKIKCEIQTELFSKENNSPIFISKLFLNDQFFSEAKGKNKQFAEKKACEIFYHSIYPDNK